MTIMFAQHFLQKHQVGARTAYRFAQFGQDETAVQGSKALVCIHRQDT
jgi:hypothetical protein